METRLFFVSVVSFTAWMRFKMGAKISGGPTERGRKLIFVMGLCPFTKINQRKGVCMIAALLLPQN
ncbi:MAG: hypothetical protein JW892_01745 [Anaerolineae bacterium]|nr:hypothetical protein [Anaerolineae bacterium]